MYCKSCGKEISETTEFCSGCGSQVGNAGSHAIETKVNVIENNEIKFELKPKFNWMYKILTEGLRTLFLTLIIIFYFVVDDIPFFISTIEGTIWALIIPIGILLIPTVRLIFQAFQYERLYYNFYNTKVEYIDGFINKTQKELKYKYIREIVMSKGIVERIFGLGTIKIYTNASNNTANKFGQRGNAGLNENGITIHCLNDVKTKYEAIKKIVDEGTAE